LTAVFVLLGSMEDLRFEETATDLMVVVFRLNTTRQKKEMVLKAARLHRLFRSISALFYSSIEYF
jgi:hypothetical protein